MACSSSARTSKPSKPRKTACYSERPCRGMASLSRVVEQLIHLKMPKRWSGKRVILFWSAPRLRWEAQAPRGSIIWMNCLRRFAKPFLNRPSDRLGSKRRCLVGRNMSSRSYATKPITLSSSAPSKTLTPWVCTRATASPSHRHRLSPIVSIKFCATLLSACSARWASKRAARMFNSRWTQKQVARLLLR